MPTGYTNCVKDGKVVKFEDFTWKCARAFGAFIMQRDDNMGAPLKLTEEISDYHSESLERAKKDYLRLRKMNQKARIRFSQAKFMEVMRGRTEGMIRNQKELLNYTAMLGQVAMWVPPTEDHKGLKEFMVSQLTESVDFDCSGTYNADEMQKALDADPTYFHTEALESAKWSIAYHEKGLKEEVERVDGRNQWKRDLVDSIGYPVSSN